MLAVEEVAVQGLGNGKLEGLFAGLKDNSRNFDTCNTKILHRDCVLTYFLLALPLLANATLVAAAQRCCSQRKLR